MIREPSTGDTLALKHLESLFEEGEISSDEETSASCSWRREAGLRIQVHQNAPVQERQEIRYLPGLGPGRFS